MIYSSSTRYLLLPSSSNSNILRTRLVLLERFQSVQHFQQFVHNHLRTFASTTTTTTTSQQSNNNEPASATTTTILTTTKENNNTTTKKKDRVVVLGTGWGGFNLALHVDQKAVDLTIISPRNHFIFTPLLPSTAVGTLEPRCIQEPIRSILQPETSHYVQAKARSINVNERYIQCESIHHEFFTVPYDKLVIAVGVKTNTFGIQSIKEGALGYYNINESSTSNDGKGGGHCIFYLKQLAHARGIRANIIDCFERASIPTVSDDEKRRLLSFVVVGGGPTSCEFTAELHDFVKQDVRKLYPDLFNFVKITLVEAGPALLGPFDKALQDYAYLLFRKRDIDIKLGTAVTNVEDYTPATYRFPGKRAILSDGSNIEFGTMVWSAGLAPRTFVEELDPIIFPKHPRTKRLLVDDYLRVKGHEGTIWAMGDAAVNDTGVPLPQLAQVARQQGMYLAKVFSSSDSTVAATNKPFKFFSLGSMAFLGDLKGVYDGTSAGPVRDPKTQGTVVVPKAPYIKGFAALLLWRFAYWGRQTSIANKILIPVHWFKTFFFGRDTSRY